MHTKSNVMHKVLLSLGTNTHARFNLNRAKTFLKLTFENVQFTAATESKPYGLSSNSLFLNTLSYFRTNMNREELVLELKNIEKKMGRLPEHKPIGKIIIDIDLIKWDDEIVKPEDYKRSYIRDLLPELVDL